MEKKKNLNCLLISPPIFYEADQNIWKEVNSNFPPLGLASIASYVRSKGYSVKIMDCNIDSPAIDMFNNFFKDNFVDRYSSIGIIGITSMTPHIKKAFKIAKICKSHYPKAKIVLGGVHPTFMWEEVIKNKNVDIVCYGEGELTFEEILSGKNIEKIDGIVFKKNIKEKKRIIKNPPRKRITNLDALPMPAYDLLKIHKYVPAKGTYKKLPAMSMITSRGCPGKCTFCSKTLGGFIIFKSANKIFEEIQYLRKKYGINQILFYDDTFTVHKKNVMKLCDLLIKKKINLAWTCFARVDFIDYGMLRKMKKAGCHQIMYGVENIDSEVLKNIEKKINVKQVIRAVKWTKKAGIECRLAFMVGNPGDNRKIIEKNIRFVNRLNPDMLVVNITTPFPGTEMFKWAKKRGLILTYNWDDYTLAKPVMRLENLTVDQIKNLYKLMYRRFYFRPKFILKKMFGIRSFEDLKMLVGGANALLSFLIKRGNRR